jgi:hypothetical protein
MDKAELAASLYETAETSKAVYLRFEPEIFDYTIHEPWNLVVMNDLGITVSIPINRRNISEMMCLLDVTVFKNHAANCRTGKVVIAWGFKNLISYVQFHSKKTRDYKCRLYDLKILEGFHGEYNKAPQTFAEATARLKAIMARPAAWNPIWNGVHVPLATRVLPSLECTGIVDTERQCLVYTMYDIEKSWNGRLTCHEWSKGYAPHRIGASPRYRPPEGRFFLSLDFAAMEVHILQWLSKDKALGEIISQDQDPFEGIWERLTGDRDRKTCKMTFLPVVYGLSSDVLASRLEVSPEAAKEVHEAIYREFPDALGYVRSFQDQAQKGVVHDYFGRPRLYTGEYHKSRNFAVSSPAAVVCLDKLIRLHDMLESTLSRIAYTVHDSYVLLCDNLREIPLIAEMCREVLESESNYCPGLNLRVVAKAGKQLDKMVDVPLRRSK